MMERFIVNMNTSVGMIPEPSALTNGVLLKTCTLLMCPSDARTDSPQGHKLAYFREQPSLVEHKEPLSDDGAFHSEYEPLMITSVGMIPEPTSSASTNVVLLKIFSNKQQEWA